MAAPANVTTQTEVANLALQRIGVAAISDIDAGTDKITVAVNRIFCDTRDEVARMLPWSSLMTRTAISVVAASDSAFTNKQTLADTVLRVIKLQDNAGAENVDFAIEGTTIYYDLTSGYIVHVARTATVATWDPLFLTAVECRIAQKVAFHLTGDPQLSQLMLQEFVTILTMAVNVKAVETHDDNAGLLMALNNELSQMLALRKREVVE